MGLHPHNQRPTRKASLPCILMFCSIGVMDGLSLSSHYPCNSNKRASVTARRQESRGRTTTTLYSTAKPPHPPTPCSPINHKIEPESNFWYSVVRRDGQPENDDAPKVPCMPSLEENGPLPRGAYRVLGDPSNEPIPTCLVTVAVDLASQGWTDKGPSFSQGVDPNWVTSRLHQFIDHGFTTFQLKGNSGSDKDDNDSGDGGQEWGEENIYGRLRRETPPSVFRACHLVVPYHMPSSHILTRPSVVRDTVLQALHRIGGDCIDTLQVPYNSKSPYYLDVLDCLQELKRDGLVRSVGGKNLPPSHLRIAAENGFTLDSNQIHANLLNPTASYNRDMQQACDECGTQLLVAGPLAGGLLTNRHLDKRVEPFAWELTPKERTYLQKTVMPWSNKHNNNNNNHSDRQQQALERTRRARGGSRSWATFQRVMLETLGDVAMKHRVSVASIALRWALQLDHVASVVVACSLGDITDDRPFVRSRALREVFRFELDDDDMERLWTASGEEKPCKEMDFRDLDFESMYGNGEDGNPLLLPNTASNRKIWL